MKKLRIVFMGTAAFAVPSLRRLAQSHHEVVAVVTTPDLPRGRGQQVSFTPIKELAVELGLPVLQPDNLKDEQFIASLRSYNADVFLVVAYRILPPEVFELPSLGCINLHASLLPKYRGAAPINWAIMRGETETGVTTFFIQKKVDTGTIILQRKTIIGENETVGELHDRLSEIGADVFLETADLIAENKVVTRVQDDQLATTAPKLFKETCRIDWTRSSREIKNTVRGLSPYPCAWTTIDGEAYKIFRIETVKTAEQSAPGTIIVSNKQDGIWIQTGDGVVAILELQPPSKKRMKVTDFLNGRQLPIGIYAG
ncbi:MAG TPA: methionyl-tRNA formyltransferase [bacterium]|nr:methionyl-tRNA formyltransferase [bacterium]